MPSPANGEGACVFQPAGLFTTSRCSSSKMTQDGDGRCIVKSLKRYIVATDVRINSAERCNALPKIPRAAPHDPCAKQKVRDGVGGHGIAEAIFAEDKTLIRESAENSRQPFIVRKAEDGGCSQKGQPREMI